MQVLPRAKALRLHNGATVHYDWLVLCPGSTYADGPIKNFKGSCEDRRAVIHVRPALQQWLAQPRIPCFPHCGQSIVSCAACLLVCSRTPLD